MWPYSVVSPAGVAAGSRWSVAWRAAGEDAVAVVRRAETATAATRTATPIATSLLLNLNMIPPFGRGVSSPPA